MLTGDKNIVDVHFRVNWQIDPAKPEDYVFNILSPRETVKAVAESIMREVVGLKTIDGILTTDRAAVETDVQKRMQDVLDDYRAGVLVKQVQLQSVDAPSQVIPAYRDVTAAQQDQQRAVNEAETYANKVVPDAEGGASRIVAEANAYKRADDPRRQGSDRALRSDLRAVQEGARRDARAHVSRDDGARARRDGEDAGRLERREPRRCPTSRSTRCSRSPREPRK